MSIYIFIISICIGSFMNVLIYRIPKKEEFFISKSYCPHCKHILSGKDLIPIFSYLSLKGKCRYCKSIISIQYPLIECISGFVGVYCYSRYGFNMNWMIHFIVIELCLVISIIDIKTMIIPDELNFVIFILSLIRIFMYDLNLFDSLIHALVVPIIFIVLNKFYIECIGGGDIKFIFSIGLLLANRVYIAFYISVFTAAIYAIYLLFIKKYHRKSKFPFGPFLAFGSVNALLFGKDILRIYNIFIS